MGLMKEIGVAVKRDVVFADIAMTLYCLWLIMTESQQYWIGFVFGYTPFGARMLYKASDLYHLCWVHKSMLVHTMMVTCCIVYEYAVGFGGWLLFVRCLMLGYGILNMIVLISKTINSYRQWKRIALSQNS